MDSPVDTYSDSRARLASLTDGEVERIASGRFARDAEPGLLVALREELSRRGLRARPIGTAEPALPRQEDEIARVERGERIRAERF